MHLIIDCENIDYYPCSDNCALCICCKILQRQKLGIDFYCDICPLCIYEQNLGYLGYCNSRDSIYAKICDSIRNKNYENYKLYCQSMVDILERLYLGVTK